MTGVELVSTIVCPRCRRRDRQTMPTDYCLIAYDCPACGSRLAPKRGHCCVFCSYGSMPCPPVQRERACCG